MCAAQTSRMRPGLCAAAQLRAVGQGKSDASDSGVRPAVSEKLFDLFNCPRDGRDAFLRCLTLGGPEDFDFAEPVSVHAPQVWNRAGKRGEQGHKDLR